MIEQPVNLSTVTYLGVFSRAEQRVLQVIFKEIAEGAGSCAATLAMIARDSNTSKSTTRNAIAHAVAFGLLAKTERRSYCAISLPNILSYGQMLSPLDQAPMPLRHAVGRVHDGPRDCLRLVAQETMRAAEPTTEPDAA
jgi:hypothetical protein